MDSATLARFSVLIRPDACTGSIESSSKSIFPSGFEPFPTPSFQRLTVIAVLNAYWERL
jgi:hypothetical protein